MKTVFSALFQGNVRLLLVGHKGGFITCYN